MKTTRCLFVLMVFVMGAGIVQAVTVNNYDFEGNGLGPTEWADNVTPTGWTWNGSESRGIGLDGTNHFYWQGNASILYQTTGQVITAANISFTLTVNVRDSWASNPQITLYYDDAGTRIALGSAAGSGTDNVWETVELTVLTTAASVGKNLGVALSQSGDTGWSHFDNVVLINNIVTLISPVMDAAQVAVTDDLVWSVAPAVTKIDLFFGLENDPNLSIKPAYKVLTNEPATTTSYSPTMAYSTKYYWKVIAYEPNTAPGAADFIPTASDVAAFTTSGPAPVIQSMTPYAQSVPGGVGQGPTITVSGNNLENYLWKKGGVVLTNAVKYGGLNTATLTINDMTLGDEGIYTCEVSNSLSPDIDTANAVVVTERLVSWWKLDGNLNDSIQEVVAGAIKFDGVADPKTEFTTDNSGIDGGNSLVLQIADPNCPVVPIAGTEEFFNFYEDSFTVSAWIRTSYVNSSTWPAIISKAPNTAMGYFVSLDGQSEVVTEIDGTRIYSDGPVVFNGQWHMVSLTYDGSVQRIYVDGQLEGISAVTAADAAGNTAPVILGAWNLASPDADFEGNMDNVRIYSYALTTTQIGQEYVAMNPNVDYVCNHELPALLYDFDGNCRIDLNDFTDFAAAWLDCNRIPDATCGN
jgi:hypothetical protein